MTEDKITRVWEVIEKVGVCMMVTRFAEGLRARPLEARPERNANMIWFVTDVRGTKDDEIAEHAEVCLVFIDHKAKAYLSLTGHAVVTRDPRQGGRDLAEDRRCMVVRAGRSERARAALHAGARRTVGRTGERRGRGIRVRQGARDRRKAKSRREPQSNDRDVTASVALSKAWEQERRCHVTAIATRVRQSCLISLARDRSNVGYPT